MRTDVTWFGMAPGGSDGDQFGRPSGGYGMVEFHGLRAPSGSPLAIGSRAANGGV
jgi:hypothetical protein